MNARLRTIKQLVDDGLYAIDETVVAEAIVLRAKAIEMLPDIMRRVRPAAPVRSFRRHRGARSFHLIHSERGGWHRERAGRTAAA